VIWPVLQVGSVGPEIGNWQRFLIANRYYDDRGEVLTIDERFGPLTEQATKAYQRDLGIPSPSGAVDANTRRRARVSGFVPFIQAKNYYKRWPLPSRPTADSRSKPTADSQQPTVKKQEPTLKAQGSKLIAVTSSRPRALRHIVIHTMESPEKPGTADNVARWFAGEHAPTYPAPAASAHFCLDPDYLIQCVRTDDVAWGARGRYSDGTYVNDAAIHVEHAGHANQTPVDWDDGRSRLILWRSAKLIRELAAIYDLPLVRVDVEGLRAGERGITGHVDISKAFHVGDSKWDPGPGFPWDRYVEMLRQ
jgi:N-acetyl-anhydromuramyl-L-alanine amidase AmpD